MNYDLEKRTREFAKSVINFVKQIQKDKINENIVSQLLRSATSVGANYCEANGASSKKDFSNKIFICRKEVQESKYWIEMLATATPDKKEALRDIWKEAHELTLIFNKISTSIRNNN